MMIGANNTSDILLEKKEKILRITINRPEKKNALTWDMSIAMAEATNQANDDIEIRVILLHGSTDCFTAGADLQGFKNYKPDGSVRPVNPFLLAVSLAEKPIVAAVGGPAIGVGATMLLHFDLVYAGEGAQFRMPFVNLGLCPEAASSFLLPKLIGHQRASELLLMGEPFTAAKAMEIGLVNAVYPDSELIDRAYEQAKKLAQQPPASVKLTKALLKRSISSYVADTMTEEAKHFTERLGSEECKEAVSAFYEHREPDF